MRYVVTVNQPENLCTADFKSIVLIKFAHAFKRAGKRIDLGACANLNRTTDLKSGVIIIIEYARGVV